MFAGLLALIGCSWSAILMLLPCWLVNFPSITIILYNQCLLSHNYRLKLHFESTIRYSRLPSWLKALRAHTPLWQTGILLEQWFQKKSLPVVICHNSILLCITMCLCLCEERKSSQKHILAENGNVFDMAHVRNIN